MTIGRANRRRERAERVQAAFGDVHTEAALDILELTEFAWHDCYSEITPPEDVLDDILTVAHGDLASLARAARLAVEDFRDLRLQADDIRNGGQ